MTIWIKSSVLIMAFLMIEQRKKQVYNWGKQKYKETYNTV